MRVQKTFRDAVGVASWSCLVVAGRNVAAASWRTAAGDGNRGGISQKNAVLRLWDGRAATWERAEHLQGLQRERAAAGHPANP